MANQIDESSDYFIQETASIDDGAIIGPGTRVWHYSHIRSGANIGSNCHIGQNVYIGVDVQIGNCVKVQNNVSVYECVTLEDYVFCGPSCVFTNDLTPRAKYPKGLVGYKPTVVREGATIGANATIVCGNEIGKWSMVAAGALVTKDVPEYTLVAGVPATPRGCVCRCGKITVGLTCPDCGRAYRESKKGYELIGESLSEGV